MLVEKTKCNRVNTLPTATAVVAISKTKLSFSLAGAPNDKGFVPRAACKIKFRCFKTNLKIFRVFNGAKLK